MTERKIPAKQEGAEPSERNRNKNYAGVGTAGEGEVDHLKELRRINEEYERRIKEGRKPEKRITNWPKIFSGIFGGITVGMFGVLAIVGLMTGTMKVVTKNKD